ncbi:RDD family protein [Methanothermobacter sp.]|uniref:RDD family protein n=1 Tax=Methanothermobacter sp. TaxID=1884223 RepID=UPI002632D655|nr:RDD family protein [Methanothermobacter sp.]MDI9617776.1 RDD family protein [Methanothermobacter sp.]
MELKKKRLYAFLVDFLVVTGVMYLLTVLVYPLALLLNIFSIYNYWLLLLGIITILYFSYLEYHGGTVGKRMMGLHVISEEDELRWQQLVIRNLSRILWFPLILDVILGRSRNRLRLLDAIAGTRVVSAEENE